MTYKCVTGEANPIEIVTVEKSCSPDLTLSVANSYLCATVCIYEKYRGKKQLLTVLMGKC